MAKKKNKNIYKENMPEVIDVESVPVVEENKPTLAQGNYVIEIISNGKVLKKLAVAQSEINITKLEAGGLVVDLK
ncbi:MAG: hypothetical protein ACRC41_15990 [Sarcina sp.]